MACTVRDTLEEFDIIQKLYCITTDNAKNNIKMAEHLAKMLAIEDVEWDPTINHVRCLTHIINLVVQEFLDTLQIASPAGNEITTSFRSTLLKVRKIAKSIRSSPQRWEVFQRACRAFEIKPITIPLDVPTRWDSGYDMLEPFIYLRRPICRYLDDFEEALGDLRLMPEEWDQAEILLFFLMPFKRCTKRFECSHTEPEIEYTFYAYNTMYNHIDDVKDALKLKPGLGSIPSAPFMLAAILAMEETLKIYYDQTKIPTVYGDAMILDPRSKLSLFDEDTWKDVDRNIYVDGCRNRFLNNYASPSPPASILDTSYKSFKEMRENRSKKRRRNDFDRYIEIPEDYEARTLPWWKDHHTSYLDLNMQARDNLAVPASGCEVERQFSVSGRIATWERNRLNSQTISDSMMYKSAMLRKGKKVILATDIDEDLIMPEVRGEISSEWSDRWWEQKTKYPLRPEIRGLFPSREAMNEMAGLDNDDTDDLF
jgi:hAT family C-terminal dimerisation region